jgi:hypothetical protein
LELSVIVQNVNSEQAMFEIKNTKMKHEGMQYIHYCPLSWTVLHMYERTLIDNATNECVSQRVLITTTVLSPVFNGYFTDRLLQKRERVRGENIFRNTDGKIVLKLILRK